MPRAPIPWPPNWYRARYDIHCIVPHCDFVTDANRMSEQWSQLYGHCTCMSDAEHGLLKLMLRQSKCAWCDHPPFCGGKDYIIRALCEHEETVHGTVAMFHIDSFVALVRENRVLFGAGGHLKPNPNCERLVFERMMDKVGALPAADLRLLFETCGFDDDEGHNSDHLAKILTADRLKRKEDKEPYWKPLQPDRFLAFCCPNGGDPPDGAWRRVWRSLRDKYADGRI